MRPRPIDITQLGQEARHVERLDLLDREEIRRKNRVVVVYLREDAEEGAEVAVAGRLESLNVPAIVVAGGQLSGVRILSRVEVKQVRDVCEDILADLEPRALEPDEAKAHAVRVVEAMRGRPELYEEVAQLIMADEAMRRG